MSSKVRKLFKLLKCHKKESIKVGLFITAHSLSYIGIPYIFKGTQLLKQDSEKNQDVNDQEQKKEYKENKDQQYFIGLKERFNKLPLNQKYVTYFGVCLTYLVCIGILTKHQIYHSRKLEDLFTITLRRKIFRKLFADRKQHIDQSVTVQKTVSDVYRITSSLAQSYFMILRGAVFSTTGLTATVYYFPELGVLTAIYLFLFGLRNRWYSKQIQDASKLQIQYLQKISAEMGEFTSNRKYVILNQMENLSEQIFEQRMQSHHQKILDLANIRGKQVFFLETFGIGYILSLITYGTYLIATGNLLTQDLSLSIFALYGALGLRRLNSGFIELREKLGILDTIESFFNIDLLHDIENEKFVQDGELTEQFMFDLENNFDKIENVYEIENQLKNQHLSILEDYLEKQLNQTSVEIEYLNIPVLIKNQKSNRVIQNLKVIPGECLGVFGQSGIGKTSLFDFISGFRVMQLEDKINFESQQKKDPRIFYFTQIPQIFNKSFIFNVVIGNVPLLKYILSLQDLSYQEKLDLIVYYARNAMIKARILEKCQQQQSVKSLSTGEKQRLIFARLFFSNSDIILLDESMANLDYANSQQIQKELKEFLSNRTGFFIAHNRRIVNEICKDKIYHIKQLNQCQVINKFIIILSVLIYRKQFIYQIIQIIR